MRAASVTGSQASPRPALSAQATRVANARRVIEAVKQSYEGWGVKGFTLTLAPPLAAFFAQTDKAAAAQLFRLEHPSPAEVERARKENQAVRAELVRTKRYPMSTLFCHVTRTAAVAGILESANYDALFNLTDAHDTPTLGLVDTTRIDGTGPLVTTREVAKGANAGFGDMALLYDPARLDAQLLAAARGTEYNNHWTYAIALPTTALMAIQLLEPTDAKTVASLREAAARFAIPIVDAHGQTPF